MPRATPTPAARCWRLTFNRAFVAVGLLSGGSVLMFWRLAPNAGAEVSGHGRDEAERAAAE